MTVLAGLTSMIALWLMIAGVVTAVRPASALAVTAKPGSTVGLRWLEHSPGCLAGVVLVLVAPGQGDSWQSALVADTKETAEARLANLGYSVDWPPERVRRLDVCQTKGRHGAALSC